MLRIANRAAAAALCLCACALPAHAAPPQRSVSTSRQFIVYGADARLRGAICDLAERMKSSALALLAERDNWKTPIVINAVLPEANRPDMPAAQLNLGQTGFGLKLQLELRIGGDINARDVERELLRAIFLEMIYRALPDVAAGTPYVQPPDWLLDATVVLSDEAQSAAIAQTLGTIIATNEITPLSDFLRQRRSLLESPSRAVYRAYSAALVAALVESPEGRPRLARFLAELPRAGNDPLADLQAHFPSLGSSPEKMQKSWTLSIARFAARERYRLLDCEETERQLAQTLRLELRDKGGRTVTYSLEEFPAFLNSPGAASALIALRQQLLLLSARVNPLFQPVVTEYQRIAMQLARKKSRRVTERLAELRAMREHIRRRMSAITDYMNWFEATQSRSTSGVFAEYMKAAELALEDQQSRRHDPISVYLDALEAQFSE